MAERARHVAFGFETAIPVLHIVDVWMQGISAPHAFGPFSHSVTELKQYSPPPFGSAPGGMSRSQNTVAAADAAAAPVLQMLGPKRHG